jgi:hypothetical protein
MEILPMGVDFLPMAEWRTDGQTDKNGEINNNLSQFFERTRNKTHILAVWSSKIAFCALFT